MLSSLIHAHIPQFSTHTPFTVVAGRDFFNEQTFPIDPQKLLSSSFKNQVVLFTHALYISYSYSHKAEKVPFSQSPYDLQPKSNFVIPVHFPCGVET